MRFKCRHCEKLDCYTHCQEADDGKHVVDTTSASSINGTITDGTIIVDFNCRKCGQTGAVQIDSEKITWD